MSGRGRQGGIGVRECVKDGRLVKREGGKSRGGRLQYIRPFIVYIITAKIELIFNKDL